MTFIYPIEQARQAYPEFEIISALTPSAQKAAFHVKQNEQDFCLKIIAPNYRIERLDREIIALQSLSHKNIVKFVEHFNSTSGGVTKHYILEEFIEGNDLAATIGSIWTRTQISNVFSELCDGLAELKSENIVHRDLKPSNIRIKTDGTPVIVDFGVARLLDMVSVTDTPVGASIGTPMYFAPEQFTGQRHDIDHRTDLFALGIQLHEVATGKHPFFNTGMTYNEHQEAVCLSDSYKIQPEFTQLPIVWQQLINRLLSKSKINRPYGSNQVAGILRNLVNV